MGLIKFYIWSADILLRRVPPCCSLVWLLGLLIQDYELDIFIMIHDNMIRKLNFKHNRFLSLVVIKIKLRNM